MFTNEIVNAEMQRDRVLVCLEVFAVSERFTPKISAKNYMSDEIGGRWLIARVYSSSLLP
jgi:hypothetical protein